MLRSQACHPKTQLSPSPSLQTCPYLEINMPSLAWCILCLLVPIIFGAVGEADRFEMSAWLFVDADIVSQFAPWTRKGEQGTCMYSMAVL